MSRFLDFLANFGRILAIFGSQTQKVINIWANFENYSICRFCRFFEPKPIFVQKELATLVEKYDDEEGTSLGLKPRRTWRSSTSSSGSASWKNYRGQPSKTHPSKRPPTSRRRWYARGPSSRPKSTVSQQEAFGKGVKEADPAFFANCKQISQRALINAIITPIIMSIYLRLTEMNGKFSILMIFKEWRTEDLIFELPG